MRRLFLVAAAGFAFAVAPSAGAATQTVLIRAAGFQPATVTVRAGDTVVWRNVDTRRHQIVSDRGVFASPVLARNETWQFTFAQQGTFRYHDGLEAAERGVVAVRAPAAAVTLTASAPTVVYGSSTMLQGAVSSRRANEAVTIFARPYGQLSFIEVARVLTTTGGFWAYSTKPTALTAYRVHYRGAASGEVAVQVRPKLTLRPWRRSFITRVTAGRSFAGRYVVFQRRTADGRWIGVARLKLGTRSGRIFKIPRRRGVSVYRVYLTAGQAGPGYTASWSGTQRVRR